MDVEGSSGALNRESVPSQRAVMSGGTDNASRVRSRAVVASGASPYSSHAFGAVIANIAPLAGNWVAKVLIQHHHSCGSAAPTERPLRAHQSQIFDQIHIKPFGLLGAFQAIVARWALCRRRVQSLFIADIAFGTHQRVLKGRNRTVPAFEAGLALG